MFDGKNRTFLSGTKVLRIRSSKTDNLENWKRKPDSRIVLRKLRALLRRESKFAAFKRNYIRENKSQYSQLLPYIEETIL